MLSRTNTCLSHKHLSLAQTPVFVRAPGTKVRDGSGFVQDEANDESSKARKMSARDTQRSESESESESEGM